jgi:hypothetical protein
MEYASPRGEASAHQHRAQVLLEDIQRLELRKSNWQDAHQIRKDYGKHVEAMQSARRRVVTLQ